MAVRFELEDLNMRPDPEPLLTEMIHAVGGLELKNQCIKANLVRFGSAGSRHSHIDAMCEDQEDGSMYCLIFIGLELVCDI